MATRNAVIDRWLAKHHATLLYALLARRDEPTLPTVEAWKIGGSVAYVIQHPNGSWDIATTLDSTDVGETFEDAEKRLGL